VGKGLYVLLLAPEPFYQERGTPIAVNLVMKVLSERGDRVDVLAYHEGSNVHHVGVTMHRIPDIGFIRDIRPGFSWKKVICDLFMLFTAIRLVLRNRYQLIHAVEEAVFIALIVKWVFGIPYVYDMDSSLAQQMVEKYPRLSRFESVFNVFERLAVRNAKVVVPVSDGLADIVRKYKPQKLVVIHDVSLLTGVGP